MMPRHDIYLPFPEILMLDLHLRCLLFLHVVLNFVPSPKLHLGFTNSAFGCTVPQGNAMEGMVEPHCI